MKSFTTPNFWKAYAALSPEIKEQARKAYQQWIRESITSITTLQEGRQEPLVSSDYGGFPSIGSKKGRRLLLVLDWFSR